MKIYHYASLDDWPGIKHGSWKSREVPGLGPNLRVCKDNYEDEEARNGAVFGLIEPEPIAWTENVDFPFVWSSLMRNTGRLLLAYEATDEIVDSSYVIDWSHMERMLGGYKDDVANDMVRDTTHSDRGSAERLYWASRVSLADYIDDPVAISRVALPEVITMCHVPLDLIELADVQPKLQDMPPYLQEDIAVMIGRNPELEALSAYLPAA